MTKILAVAALAVAALAIVPVGVPVAQAQTRPSNLTAEQALTSSRTGIPAFNPDQGMAPSANGPTFRAFGVPVQVSAPVNAPYTQSAMQTFAGQPMLGSDAVVARGSGTE